MGTLKSLEIPTSVSSVWFFTQYPYWQPSSGIPTSCLYICAIGHWSTGMLSEPHRSFRSWWMPKSTVSKTFPITHKSHLCVACQGCFSSAVFPSLHCGASSWQRFITALWGRAVENPYWYLTAVAFYFLLLLFLFLTLMVTTTLENLVEQMTQRSALFF